MNIKPLINRLKSDSIYPLVLAIWCSALVVVGLAVMTHIKVAKTQSAVKKVAALPRGKSVHLASLSQDLPSREVVSTEVHALSKLADRYDIASGRVTFSPGRSDGGVSSVQVSIPAQGTYQNLRTYLDSSLSVLPNVALLNVSLERADTQALLLDADIRFAIYFSY